MTDQLVVQLRHATLRMPLRPFAVHYWFAVGAAGTIDWQRWEVWQKPNCCPTSWGHVHLNLMPPDSAVGGGPCRINCEWRGAAARRIAAMLATPTEYPYWHRYHYWPGPNSNTYAAWVLRAAGISPDLDPRAFGKDFRGDWGFSAGWGKGHMHCETPLIGIRINHIAGLEIHLLGATFGLGFSPLRIKTPAGILPSARTFPGFDGSIE